MPPFVLVLSDLSDMSRQVAQMAALVSAPLQARLVLLHLCPTPVLAPELAGIPLTRPTTEQGEAATALQALTQGLPPGAQEPEILVSVKALPEAVADAVRRYQPLLLVMGLSAEPTLLDQLLRNQALPVLRATGLPLLLVPANTAPEPPRRVAIAVDAQVFLVNAASRALAPLFYLWPATYTVVHVAAEGEQQAFPGQRALANVRSSKLLADQPLELYEEQQVSAAAGVLQALDDIQADLLVLPVREHSFLSRLFHHSVTTQVLRGSRVPVLLLPAAAPPHSEWMPNVC
jgi:nucleotide-binding universal stress UspA family protein